jgi:hypothetical protein
MQVQVIYGALAVEDELGSGDRLVHNPIEFEKAKIRKYLKCPFFCEIGWKNGLSLHKFEK